MNKDYYKILGVTEFDSAENIKSAYRRLARKWHPDIAGNSDEAIIRFKEINEAYEILSNNVKKSEYDRARRFYSYAKENSYTSNKNTYAKTGRTRETDKNINNENSNKKADERKNFYFNWEEFLSRKKRDTSFQQEKREEPKRGEDINSDIEITQFEALSGISKTVNMLQSGVCPFCGGKKFVNGTICKHCQGKGGWTNYKKFTVKIPAGIKNGSKIRLANEGGAGINGGKNGDLYITVHVKPSQNYTSEGLNILKTIPIAPYEAILGTELRVNTTKGNMKVKIAPNTQNGQKIRLAGCGLVQNEIVGDMIITVEIKIPHNISQEEFNLYKKLREISSENVRENLYE